MIDKKSALIAMFVISFFMVFLAIKQFSVLREQVYRDAYLGIE